MRKFLATLLLCLLPLNSFAFGSLGCDNKTLLLIHSDTGFTDEGCNGTGKRTLTLNNTPTIDKAVYKLGTGSGNFASASSQSVDVPTSSDWNFRTGDFTIDCWVNTASISTTDQTLIEIQSFVAGIRLEFNDTGNPTNFIVLINGGTLTYTFTSAPVDGTWFHLAVVRASSQITLYKDGVAQGASQASSDDINNDTLGVTIGGLVSHVNQFFNGHIDEMRISNFARWTANFTPPTTPYCSGCEMKEVMI